MTNLVWKFPIIGASGFVDTRADAEPLYVALQGNHPMIWMRVNPTAPKVHRAYRVVGTGEAIGSEWVHAGTWQELGGALIWHLFLSPEERPAQ